MRKIKAVQNPQQEKCPYCNGTGEVSPSPAVRIRTLRQNNELGQQEFANMIGVSRAQVANLETGRGNCSVDLLMRIADRFQISVDWLLGRTNEE